MAAMIILLAVLFMTATTSPSPAEGQSGLDLAKVSADTLRVLQQRPPETDIAPNPDPTVAARPYPSRLDELVDEVLKGTDLTANEALMRELVPAGNRYQLRIDNGVDHLVILPVDTDFTTQPRAAKAAETFIVPRWQDNSLLLADCNLLHPPATVHTPGGDGPLTLLPTDTLTAPNGMTTMLDGRTWMSWWTAALADDGLASDKIPRAALYGWWMYNNGGVDTCFFVGLGDGTTSLYPSYGIQLVVWPIA